MAGHGALTVCPAPPSGRGNRCTITASGGILYGNGINRATSPTPGNRKQVGFAAMTQTTEPTAAMNASVRDYSALDRVLQSIDNALATTLGTATAARASPGATQPHVDLTGDERRHAAGLMRVNHTGEVCAQALYVGQSVLARDEETRRYLLDAAREENDHLAWCAQRLDELDDRPSVLNPLWYAGAWTIGAVAAALSDRWSLGFVVETERQVEAHLGEHLDRLPAADARSRAVLTQMQIDEARHAAHARDRGGIELPPPVPALMAMASRVMKAVAYRV